MNDYSRYIRQANIIALDGQKALANTKLLCIGSGGLGSLVSSYLVAAGVGSISLVDGDKIELTNLTRQISYKETDCNKSKALIQAEFLQQLNSTCNIIAHDKFLDKSNAYELINAHDLIVDCSDNFITRYLISDTCTALSKPLISASIEGFIGQVMVLLPEVCYRCIFPKVDNNFSCLNGDVIGPAVGVIASIQANEVFKFITNLSKKSHLIQVDSFENKISTFDVITDTKCINNHDDILLEVGVKIKQLDFNEVIELAKQQKIQLVDIRNKKSEKINNIIKHISKDKPIAIMCNYGYRSKLSASQLSSVGYENVYYAIIDF